MEYVEPDDYGDLEEYIAHVCDDLERDLHTERDGHPNYQLFSLARFYWRLAEHSQANALSLKIGDYTLAQVSQLPENIKCEEGYTISVFLDPLDDYARRELFGEMPDFNVAYVTRDGGDYYTAHFRDNGQEAFLSDEQVDNFVFGLKNADTMYHPIRTRLELPRETQPPTQFEDSIENESSELLYNELALLCANVNNENRNSLWYLHNGNEFVGFITRRLEISDDILEEYAIEFYQDFLVSRAYNRLWETPLPLNDRPIRSAVQRTREGFNVVHFQRTGIPHGERIKTLGYESEIVGVVKQNLQMLGPYESI